MMTDWEQYDQEFYQESNGVFLEENRTVESIIKNLNITGMHCLDFGCGSGHWIPFFLENRATVTGVDISVNAVKRCQALYPNGNFFTVKNCQLPIAASSIDLVTATWVLQELHDHRVFVQSLDEIKRTLKIRGYFFAANNIYPDPGSRLLIESTAMGDIFDNNGQTPTRLRFFPGDSMLSIMKLLGFDRIEYSRKGFSFFELFVKVRQ